MAWNGWLPIQLSNMHNTVQSINGQLNQWSTFMFYYTVKEIKIISLTLFGYRDKVRKNIQKPCILEHT
jgi:hypothetical protein